MYLEEGETDWLGSRPIFYNTRTNRISDNINELIEDRDIEFHPEGLRNYLDYGYSVFEQTPLKNICFLPANCKVWIENGKIKIQKLSDPFETRIGNSANPDDTIECIRNIMNQWEFLNDKKIIVPTSAGFDSRLINSMLLKKSNVQAFTYGISANQRESIEVVYASCLCRELGIEWEQVELGQFLDYMDEWNDLYGISTHAHGMYQLEFYDKIAKKGLAGSRVISGIYGDLWAGNWNIDRIEKSGELKKLSINHGVMVDPICCKLPEKHELRDSFFEENRYKLNSQEWRILLAARTKIILLSYLLRVPHKYGFEVWSPFLDIEVVSKMLNLDWKEKTKRRWQVDYFRKNNLLIGERNLKCDMENCLDEKIVRKHACMVLDVQLLSEIIDERFLMLVNRKLREKGKDLTYFFNIYTVLYPLERLLRRRG